MKFDKRYIFAASLVLAMGLGTYGCSDDDDKDKGGDTPQVTNCDGAHMSKDADGKCVCDDGYKLDGDSCVEEGGEQPADCTGEHMKKDDNGKCICDEGYKLEGGSCVEEGGEQPADCTGEHMKKDADGKCVCDEGYKLEGDSCVKEGGSDKPETCGNNKLDDGEICDIVDGAEQWADGNGTCEKWATENEEELDSEKEQGKPGCASNCLAHSKNPKSGTGCFSKANALCGNGKIDDGEKCDIGADGQKNTEDDVVTGATCKDYQEGTYTSGTPGCAKDCKSYAKGSCVAEGETPASDVNGIASCEATITVDADHKASGSAKATTVDKKTPKGQIICAINTSNIETVANSIKDKLVEGSADGDAFVIANGQFDGSVFTDAGDYSCAYYIEVESGKGIACKDNKPVAATGSIADLGIATFTVAGSGDSSEIAAWTTFSAETNKALASGIAPNSGSDTSAKLSFVDKSSGKIKIKLGQDAASTTSALSLDCSGNATAWGTEANMSSNSHLLIASTALASVTGAKLVLKVNTKDNTIAVTSVKDSTEEVVKNDVKTSAFSDVTIDIPDATKELRIYNISGAKAIAFDDIIVKK